MSLTYAPNTVGSWTVVPGTTWCLAKPCSVTESVPRTTVAPTLAVVRFGHQLLVLQIVKPLAGRVGACLARRFAEGVQERVADVEVFRGGFTELVSGGGRGRPQEPGSCCAPWQGGLVPHQAV